MNVSGAIRKVLTAKPEDEIMVCSQQDYYNNSNPQYNKVGEVVNENGKLIILTK